MRIGIITSAKIPPNEGIGHFIVNLGRKLKDKGHEVVITTRGRGFKREHINYDGLNVYRLPYLPLYPIHVHFHSLFIRRFLQDHKSQFDVLDFQTPLVPAIDINIPSVTTIHTLMVPAAKNLEKNRFKTTFVRWQCLLVSRSFEESLFLQSPIVCSVRQITENELSNYRIKPAHIVSVGVGVHDLFLEPFDVSNAKVENPYVLYVGRLDYNKGLYTLIHSVKNVVKDRPDVRFFLAGDGPLRSNLEKLTADEGVSEYVDFLGQINDRSMVRRLHRRATVYVQPSGYEGLPASILEAMACATPIVYTKSPGSGQLISPGEGILTTPGNSQELSEAILLILSDENKQQGMGQACREKVLTHYTWDIVSQRILDCYRQAIRLSSA